MAYASLIHNNLDSLWTIFWYSSGFPSTTDIHLSVHIFQSCDLFETTRYCSLLSTLVNLLRLNLSIWDLWNFCLFIADLSLNVSTTKQWSLSQSAILNHRASSTLKCHRLSIRKWSIWLWVFPSGDVQVNLWMGFAGYVAVRMQLFFL
jgi:hypothetical protein